MSLTIAKYLPPNLVKAYPIFKAYAYASKFLVDKIANQIILEVDNENLATGDLVFLSTTDLLPANYRNGIGVSFNILPAQVNINTNVITTLTFDWHTCYAVSFDTAGILPVPLQKNTLYYIIAISANQVKLARSIADALTGTFIDIESQGDGVSTYMTVEHLAYYYIKDSTLIGRIASSYENAIAGTHISLVDIGNGEHKLVKYSNEPTIPDVLQYVIDTEYVELATITDKYKNFFKTENESVYELIKEFGYEYIGNLASINRILNLSAIIPIIQLFKGTKKGLEIVFDQLGIGYTFTEWWEATPKRTPATYRALFELNKTVYATEYGDSNNYLSYWNLNGVTTGNSDNGVLYWNFYGDTKTIELYKDAAKTILVASGQRTGGGILTIISENASEISGSVFVENVTPNDDIDSANRITGLLSSKISYPPDIITRILDFLQAYVYPVLEEMNVEINFELSKLGITNAGFVDITEVGEIKINYTAITHAGFVDRIEYGTLEVPT